MNLNELKQLLRESGVVGAGGAGFPTYAKLSEGVHTLILNCAECEPLLKLHRQLLLEYCSEILDTFEELVRITGAKEGIIAVKKHYKSTVSAVEDELKEHKMLSLSALDSVYPAGDELILIKAVTGKTVPRGSLPSSVGVTVCNVETVYNIYRAMQGEAVTHKFVTVAGEVKKPVTLRVPIGTRVSDLIESAGGEIAENMRILCGGPMMGKLIGERDVVTKTTNALILLPENHPAILNKTRNFAVSLRRAMSVCCQCRSCTELCSRHNLGYGVEPHMVMRVLSNGGKGDIAKLSDSLFCSGCGLCEAYSCPQGLSPRAMIAELKEKAREAGYKPMGGEPYSVKDAELRKVSVERLTGRLGLKKYDKNAPLSGDMITKSVKIPLSQHIGAPAKPAVKAGDVVKAGDMVAAPSENALSVAIHSPIDGKVKSVTEKYITIS